MLVSSETLYYDYEIEAKMNEEPKQNDTPKSNSSFWDSIRYAFIALLIIVPFRMFVAQPYIVSGSSMDPTFKDGDYLIVDQLSTRFENPERGAVVIIRYPKDPSKFFIKRLIAFPGEQVDIKDGKVKISTDSDPVGEFLDDSYVVYNKNENFHAELKDGEYFVMGDNRAGSSDSRIWGPVPKKYIVGQPILRLFPVNKVSVWPGVF